MEYKVESTELPPCRVCNSKASGYHYGAVSCDACKIFFRRSLNQKRPYRCKQNDQCLIQPNISIPCSHCRFKKCLQVGMSREGIKKGRYTLTMKSITTKEVQEKQAKERDVLNRENKLQALVQSLVETSEKHPLYPPELLPMMQEKLKEHSIYMECRNAVFGPLNPVPHEEYMSWYRNTGIDIDNRRNKIEKCAKNVEQDLKAFIEYAKAVPGFRDLCIEDQINLLRGNSQDWLALSCIHIMDTEMEAFICPSCMLVFSNNDMKTYNDFTGENLFRCGRILLSLNLTKEEMSVLKAVSLINPDACESPCKEPEKVEKYYNNFVEALQYVVEKRRPGESAVTLGNIVKALTELKDLRHKFNVNSWYGLFPDIDIPELMDDLFGPRIQTEEEEICDQDLALSLMHMFDVSKVEC